MRTLRQWLAAVVAMALLGVTGLAMAAWSPASMGLVTAVSADDGAGNDDDADDGGQAPAGGVDTGLGGAAGPAQDDDADDDAGDDDADDGGQVPAGGVDTGQGGAADVWSGERVSNDRPVGDVAGLVVPVVALGLGGLVVGRLVLARLRGSQG
jgi:hypothetical protein